MRSGIFIFSVLVFFPFSLLSVSNSLGDSKLIQVKPSYAESSYKPADEIQGETGYSYRAPSPRDQMYIFWVLGKMLSYPVDKVEDFITSKLKSRENSKPIAAPAVATSRPNPFDSVNFREIPPAPPVR